jgi:hypothetical protein
MEMRDITRKKKRKKRKDHEVGKCHHIISRLKELVHDAWHSSTQILVIKYMLYEAIMEFIVQLGSCFIAQVKNTWRYDISKKIII